MSKYFSFLRKKRNPSLRDEETEFFSSKNGGRRKSGPRKSSTPQAQKLSTSSASLSSQTGDENRHSTYSLDSFDLKQETVIDPFQSDNDSLLDNTSVEGAEVYPVEEEKRVAVEAEFERDILETASEVFEKVGVIKHAVCTFVEEEDEGHVVEYDDDDDDDDDNNDNLIDDFMDEALYDLEDNVSPNVIVDEDKQLGTNVIVEEDEQLGTNVIVEEDKRETCLSEKSSLGDPSSQCSSKNTELSSNLLICEKSSVGSIAPEDENKFDGDKINVKRVELLASMLQETVSSKCVDTKLIDISSEEEVSSKNGVNYKDEVCPKEMSQELLLKASEVELEAEKNFDTVEEDLELKHSIDNYTKDDSKKLNHLENKDSNIETLLPDVGVNESIVKEDQSIKIIDCDKLVSPDQIKEEVGNQNLIDTPNVVIEEEKLVCSDFDQTHSDDSALSQEHDKLSSDRTEVTQKENEDSSLDPVLSKFNEVLESGERETAGLNESLKLGEMMSSVEEEFVTEGADKIQNSQGEDENQVDEIKHAENQEKIICSNNNNNNNNESLKTEDEPLTNLENPANSNIIDLGVTISSNDVSDKIEIEVEELSDQLILNPKNTENKEPNFSSPSSGQATDADDDDEFDSAKEDFSNEEEETFNGKKRISKVSVSENEEVKENHCSVIAENCTNESGAVTSSELVPPMDLVDSPRDLNTSFNDDETLPHMEMNAEKEKDNLTVPISEELGTSEKEADQFENETLGIKADQLNEEELEKKDDKLEKVALENEADQMPKEAPENGIDQLQKEIILTKNFDSQNISANTKSGDPIKTESSETLSLLLSSASSSKYSLLNRKNSSSGIEIVVHGSRRRSSISESSNHRFIECGERNLRKSLSQPDDRELILEEPEKKVQLVTEDNFLLTTVNADHQKAEAKLAQRRAARAEARELRLRELEKQQQQEQQENNEEEEQYAASSYSHESTLSPLNVKPGLIRTKTVTPKMLGKRKDAPVSRTPSTPRTRSSVPVNSLSRMSSEDSLPDDHLPSSARELKADLQELEEKFRKAMVLNAQLDNEKATLMYEVEFLKDKYTDLEEAHIQLTKEHKKKNSENEQLRKLSNKLKEEVRMVRRVLQERDELIQEYGLVLIGEENGEESYEDMDDEERMSDTIMDLSPRKIGVKKALLSQEASELLSKGAAKGSLDVRLRKYAEDKHELEDEVRRLKLLLEEELSNKRRENGLDYEKHKETTKSLNEFKFKIQKAEAEVSTLQANVARLESLVARYKASTEELEKSEEELKSEKRRLQRELREVKERCDELETSKAYVKRQYEKLLHDRGRV